VTRLAGLLLAAALAAPGAQAQSLQQLYQTALGYDASFLGARAALEAARHRFGQAQGLRLPQIGLGLSAGRSLASTPNAVPQNTNSTNAAATLSATQPLFNRANDLAIKQARISVDVSQTDLDAAEQDLILRLSQAYFDVLAAQDNLATARASLAAISGQVASAKRNFEIGNTTITDSREAQARFDLARATQIQAENDLRSRRIALDQTVGRSGVTPRTLITPLLSTVLEPPSAEGWVDRADAQHPAIRKARLALEIAQLETQKAKAGHLPTVNLNGSYSRGHADLTGQNQANTPYSYATPSNASSIAVTLNLPLFSGYEVDNRVRETLSLEDKSSDELDAARRSVAQATRTLFYGIGSGAAQVSALEAAESSSKLALEATQLGFKVGVRVNIDVLNAQAQLYTTQAQLAKARYDLVLAGLRLRQAAGLLTADDVGRVTELLVK
jgi:outer membrane protein